MAEGTTFLPDVVSQPRLDPQRLAWGVMLIAFAAFCMICIIIGIGVNYFLFQSSIPMETSVQIGRGSASVNAITQRTRVDNFVAGDISTDSVAQATIFFRDEQQGGRLIASVTLRGDTGLTVWRAVQPRFDWGTTNYVIDLQNFTGRLDIFVAKDLRRDLRLTITTNQGALVDLSSSGQYQVNALGSQLQVLNRQGEISITPPGSTLGRGIPVDSLGLISSDKPSEVQVWPGYFNLLQNSTFEDIFTPSGGDITQSVTQGWACTNGANEGPRGSYQPEMQDGRFVLRMLRAEGATTHGETRCGRWWPQEGYNVTGFSGLILRASFNIQYQSLNACGIDGSECPLMLRGDYIDEQGTPHFWVHGFYYALDEQLNYPLFCSSCSLEHERVKEKAWYTYDSGNFLALFPPGERPAAILNVQFYTSGHQYDVFVGELALLASS